MADVQGRVNAETLHDSENKVKYIHFDADTTSYQMKQGDQCVVATSENADASGILYLPAKAEAAGKFYYITAPTAATAGDISVYDKEAGSEIATYGDLDADDDHVLFFCDGILWRVVLNGVA